MPSVAQRAVGRCGRLLTRALLLPLGVQQSDPLLTHRAPSHSSSLPRPCHTPHQRSAMSFDQLAAVDLQLLMRCCDAQSLLALARCSRFTLSAASNPFAWRFLSPPSVPFVFRQSSPSQSSRIQSSLHQSSPTQSSHIHQCDGPVGTLAVVLHPPPSRRCPSRRCPSRRCFSSRPSPSGAGARSRVWPAAALLRRQHRVALRR